MSTYTIRKSHDGVSVLCDGKPVALAPMLQLVTPMFDYGSRSDSATNLAYAILRHCLNEGDAQLLCQEFVSDFLLTTSSTVEITDDRIREFAAFTARCQYEAQEAVRNANKI